MFVRKERLAYAMLLAMAWLLLTSCGGGGGSTDTPAAAPDPVTPLSPAIFNTADVMLSWTAPSERADGSALTVAEIGGYQICYVGSDGEINLVDVDPQQTEYLLKNLPPDDYQLNIFTYDSNNNISSPSPTVTLPLASFSII